MLADGLFWLSLLLLPRLARSRRARPAFKGLTRTCVNLAALFFASPWPLGPEERVVRRQPWVTYTIVGLCVATFQLQLIAAPGPGWGKEYERARKDAVAYVLERPYLRVPPSLELLGQRELARRPPRDARDRPDSTTMAVEQAELERKSEALYGLRRQLPTVRWGDVPAHSTWVSQLTASFVHGGWWHLLANIVFLLAFGPFLEDVFGRFLFALLYLGAAFASAGLSNLPWPGSYACSYGASGAVAGVMGAFLVRFGSRRMSLVSIPSLWFPALRVRVSAPAWAFLALWVAWNISGILNRTPGIDWLAHIGGFLFGFYLAIVLHLTRIERWLVNPAIEARVSFHQHPAVVKSFALRTKGRFESALRAVETALVAQPQNVSILREAYDASVAAGRLDRAGTHAARVLGMLATRSAPVDLKEAALFIEEARTALGSAVPARFHFAAGDCLERQGQTAEAMRLYDGLVGHPDAAIARRVAARRERLLRDLRGREWRGRPASRGTGTVQPA